MIRAFCDFCGKPFEDFSKADNCSAVAGPKLCPNCALEADNFNVLRRFAVINTRTDKVEFELVGAFALKDDSENELSKKVYVTCEMEDGTYKKHIIGLNKDTFYVVEDLGGAKVNKYRYQVNYIPESIMPFTITKSK